MGTSSCQEWFGENSGLGTGWLLNSHSTPMMLAPEVCMLLGLVGSIDTSPLHGPRVQNDHEISIKITINYVPWVDWFYLGRSGFPISYNEKKVAQTCFRYV